MRKRATSPYQIKLSYMAGRLRAPRGTPSGPEEAPQAAAKPGSTPKNREPLPSVLPTISVEAPYEIYSTSGPAGGRIDAILSEHSLATISEHPTDTYTPPSLSTMDTWTEICEDLARAMEVFTVLSTVAPAKLSSALEPSLSPSPSVVFDVTKHSPMYPSGPWNSFVFPCLSLA
ncbi:hypothetical protein C8Q77DRAFT_375033 [Trametes polyzona]|nr:hypothetical protein C8Q77DRAFT_375033 [Trametes polyzona]